MRLPSILSRWKRLPTPSRGWGLPALVTSITVTALLLGIRHLGVLMPLEMNAFDQLMRQRSLEPDARLLVVTITEDDLKTYKWPLSDAVMHELLEKLLALQPNVIGLDNYRDIPVQPGHEKLKSLFLSSDRIVPICKVGDDSNPGVSPPPGVPDERAGFSDALVDADGVARRGLLIMDAPKNSRCTTSSSLGFQLAYIYLAEKGIQPQFNSQKQLYFSNTIFKPLQPNDGGYQNIDAGGYQILLNYRSPESFKQVTLTDILNGKIDPNLVKDRIVVIGTTAPSRKDLFYTPYSKGGQENEKTPGVILHAELTSQIISTVLDNRPLFWFWLDWEEDLWIFGWSIVGGVLVWWLRRPVLLILAEGASLGVLLGTSKLIFMQAGWVPVVAPGLALVTTSLGVFAIRFYQSLQKQQDIKKLAQTNETIIDELQKLLQEMPPVGSAGDGNTTKSPEDQVTLGGENINPSILPRREHNTGEKIGDRYSIIRQLGKGGFGITYLAQDTNRPGNPECVVKHLMLANQKEEFLKTARRLFHSEGEILEKLRHPQIPKLLAFFEENSEFYLVEQFISGHPLSRELVANQTLPESFVVDLLQQVLEILIFIHSCNVIHRDLKPDNIIRHEQDSKLVLIDFGAVKNIRPQENGVITVAIGTRGYAPAEQLAGRPNFSSDIYALGMIGIQALTGKSAKHLGINQNTGNISWREHAPPIREEFAQILEKMVRYRLQERYQSAEAVLEDLQHLIAVIIS